MCDCTLIADGEFTPITIKENSLKFIYEDKFGVNHILIDKFEMDITISKATVEKITNELGETIAYRFTVK